MNAATGELLHPNLQRVNFIFPSRMYMYQYMDFWF